MIEVEPEAPMALDHHQQSVAILLVNFAVNIERCGNIMALVLLENLRHVGDGFPALFVLVFGCVANTCEAAASAHIGEAFAVYFPDGSERAICRRGFIQRTAWRIYYLLVSTLLYGVVQCAVSTAYDDRIIAVRRPIACFGYILYLRILTTQHTHQSIKVKAFAVAAVAVYNNFARHKDCSILIY